MSINVLDHYALYLGIVATILLLLGICLSEWNYRHYYKYHVILMGLSFILTTINIIIIIPETFSFFFSKISFDILYLLHLTHIIIGIVSYVLSIYIVLCGLSGIPHKKKGYAVFLCWDFNLIVGILYWGIF